MYICIYVYRGMERLYIYIYALSLSLGSRKEKLDSATPARNYACISRCLGEILHYYTAEQRLAVLYNAIGICFIYNRISFEVIFRRGEKKFLLHLYRCSSASFELSIGKGL